jgi:hypothetical protein
MEVVTMKEVTKVVVVFGKSMLSRIKVDLQIIGNILMNDKFRYLRKSTENGRRPVNIK